MRAWMWVFALGLMLASYQFGHAQTQFEMNEKSAQEYKAADAHLNAVYKELMGISKGDTRPAFISAEEQWIKYRDAESKAECALYTGGSIYPLEYNGVMTRITMAHTKELQDYISEIKSH